MDLFQFFKIFKFSGIETRLSKRFSKNLLIITRYRLVMDLCSSSTTTQRPRHAKMDGRFREIYSRALDPPRFFPWASRARLDNYSWTGFRWKPTLLARRRGGNTVGVGREKLGNMPRANIIGRATLSHGWTFNQRPSDDDAPVPRSWGHVPLSGTCIVHRSVWFHRKTVSFHRLQHPPPLCTTAPLGEIYCTPLFATGP